MISQNKRTEIEIEVFAISREMKSIHEILKTFEIEEFVNYELEELPSLGDISLIIAGRFVYHLKNFKEIKYQHQGRTESTYHVVIQDKEGKTFKIHFTFGQKMDSIKKVEKQFSLIFKHFIVLKMMNTSSIS
jgi:hypothetical protein